MLPEIITGAALNADWYVLCMFAPQPPRPMQNYHLTPISGRWKLSYDHSDVIFAGFDSRQEALEFCSEITLTNKPVCLSIHRPDGTVMEKRNFFPHQVSAPQAA